MGFRVLEFAGVWGLGFRGFRVRVGGFWLKSWRVRGGLVPSAFEGFRAWALGLGFNLGLRLRVWEYGV